MFSRGTFWGDDLLRKKRTGPQQPDVGSCSTLGGVGDSGRFGNYGLSGDVCMAGGHIGGVMQGNTNNEIYHGGEQGSFGRRKNLTSESEKLCEIIRNVGDAIGQTASEYFHGPNGR